MFGRGGVAEAAVEPSVVVPVDPLGGGELDVREGLPGSVTCDQLGPEQADGGLGECVDAPIVVNLRRRPFVVQVGAGGRPRG